MVLVPVVTPLTAAQVVLAFDALALIVRIIETAQGLWLSEDGKLVALMIPVPVADDLAAFGADHEDMEDGGDHERQDHH